MKATGKFLVVLSLFLLVAAAWAVYQGVAGGAFVDIPERALSAYRVRAWIDPFFSLLPVALCSAIIVAFSFAITGYDLNGEGSLLSQARGPLTIILVLGSLYTFWVLFLAPFQNQRLQEELYEARFVSRLLTDAERALREDGDLRRVEDRVLLARALLGDDAADDAQLRELEATLGLDANEPEQPDDRGRSDGDSTGELSENSVRTLDEEVLILIAEAESAFTANDFFTAHYRASEAIRLAGESDLTPRARELQSLSWNAIESRSREQSESDERQFFRDKLAAYEALQRGLRSTRSAMDVIDAYYRFLDLSAEHADDPDVERYFAETLEALETVSFFREEAREWVGYDGVNEVFFVNRDEDGVREFVWIARIVGTFDGTWLYDVEVLRIEGSVDDSRVIAHYGADYGRFVRNDRGIGEEDSLGWIILRAIEREPARSVVSAAGRQEIDLEQSVTGPQYYIGERGDALDEMIQLSIPLDDVVQLAGGPARAVNLPFPALFSALRTYTVLGGDVVVVWREIAARIVRVFAFFIGAYWVVALAWRYRSLYIARAPVPVFIALPLVPVGVHQIVFLIRPYLLRATDGLMTVAVSQEPYVVVAILLISIGALLGALFALARQRVEL